MNSEAPFSLSFEKSEAIAKFISLVLTEEKCILQDFDIPHPLNFDPFILVRFCGKHFSGGFQKSFAPLNFGPLQ